MEGERAEAAGAVPGGQDGAGDPHPRGGERGGEEGGRPVGGKVTPTFGLEAREETASRSAQASFRQ